MHSRHRQQKHQHTWPKSNPKALYQEIRGPGCISADPHLENIDNPMQHYFGCIEISERQAFLEKTHDAWKQERKVELQRIKATLESKGDVRDAEEAAKRADKKRGSTAVSILAQYKRIGVLREALRSGTNPMVASRGTHSTSNLPEKPSGKSVVTDIEESGRAWREGERKYRDRIREWRKKHRDPKYETSGKGHLLGSQSGSSVELEAVRKVVEEVRGVTLAPEDRIGTDVSVPQPKYDVERDVNSYLIQYTQGSAATSVDPTSPSSSTYGFPFNGENFLHFFEEDVKDQRFKGRFPDQRVALNILLEGAKGGGDPDDNILSKIRCEREDPSRIRYFHMPANNMEWVEKFIAGYYGEVHKDLDVSGTSAAMTKTQMLLRPQFWSGQQHGSRSGVTHARHMRPLCETVSAAMDQIEDNPKNIVLFMPYLHWETDRMRETISRLIEAESEKYRRKKEQEIMKDRRDRREEREGLYDDGKESTRNASATGPVTADPKSHVKKTLTGLVDHVKPRKKRDDGVTIDPATGRLRVHNKLGQYLIDAARLYEAMSTYRDQEMLERFLYNDPPLHPRRTLDQSYYWTLRTTKGRDRDQVVYRGTNINLEFCHKYQPRQDEHKTLLQKLISMVDVPKVVKKLASETKEKKPLEWAWHGHDRGDELEHGCDQCLSDIRKVSQIVMVDQLWMWILDERTIITSFPRRYGFNKHDVSGVHKSIRMRLKSARKNQIRSVYDLALIILDECCNTFFDRTKTHDGQPKVMDIFSEAIGLVTNKHTISFRHVWHWTEKASDVYRAMSKYVSSSQLHVPLLDINPEGKLQREIKDIIDELDMMIHIHNQQRDVIKRFCKHVEHILDPEGSLARGDEEGTTLSRQHSSFSNPPTGLGINSPSTPRFSRRPTRKGTVDEYPEKASKMEQLSWFRIGSQELLCDVHDRIAELEGLRKGAESTAQSVNDLLSLKQQQASVIQAWESVRRADESVSQGRAIMIFTLVTIVFLPLSFMSSIFGMNNVDFTGEGTWRLVDQFKLMFPISIGIIVVTVILAFSNALRAIIWSAYTYTGAWLMINSGLYRLWLSFRDELGAQKLMRATEKKVNAMKEEVAQAKKQRRSEKLREEMEKEEAEEARQKKEKMDRRPGSAYKHHHANGTGAAGGAHGSGGVVPVINGTGGSTVTSPAGSTDHVEQASVKTNKSGYAVRHPGSDGSVTPTAAGAAVGVMAHNGGPSTAHAAESGMSTPASRPQSTPSSPRPSIRFADNVGSHPGSPRISMDQSQTGSPTRTHFHRGNDNNV